MSFSKEAIALTCLPHLGKIIFFNIDEFFVRFFSIGGILGAVITRTNVKQWYSYIE